jgi:hypothetical protein
MAEAGREFYSHRYGRHEEKLPIKGTKGKTDDYKSIK